MWGARMTLQPDWKDTKRGYVEFTKSRLPVSAFLTINFGNKYKAFEFEKYLKRGSGREFARRHFLPRPP
jgi:hypothetical protein